jgi:hypothetical protein
MRRRLLWILGGTLVAIVGAVVILRFQPPGAAPPGQPPVEQLDVERFRRTFNAASNETRVLIMLSPT